MLYNQPPLYIPYKDIVIIQREDYYINSSPVLRLFNKTYASWSRTKEYQLYLEAISSNLGIASSNLMSIEPSGIWLHPCLFTKLAKWLNPGFEVFLETNVLYPFSTISSISLPSSISLISNLIDVIGEDLRIEKSRKVIYKLKAVEKVYPSLTLAVEYLSKELLV